MNKTILTTLLTTVTEEKKEVLEAVKTLLGSPMISASTAKAIESDILRNYNADNPQEEVLLKLALQNEAEVCEDNTFNEAENIEKEKHTGELEKAVLFLDEYDVEYQMNREGSTQPAFGYIYPRHNIKYDPLPEREIEADKLIWAIETVLDSEDTSLSIYYRKQNGEKKWIEAQKHTPEEKTPEELRKIAEKMVKAVKRGENRYIYIVDKETQSPKKLFLGSMISFSVK